MIPSFAFYRTPKLIFGVGEFNKIGAYSALFGKRVLVITGGDSLRASGRLRRLCEDLERHSLLYFVASIKGEPSPVSVDTIVRDFRERQVSLVIGIGGGSVMDAAKTVSAMLTCDDSVLSYIEGVGDKPYSGKKTPFLAIPTTSGTGSEATNNAVLSRVGVDGFKKSMRHENLVPDIALIDPELTLSCPEEITAACGMDTFSQLLESYVSTQASPMTDSLAVYGLQAVIDHLLSAYTRGSSEINARASMAFASFISGITLANAGLGVIHGLAGPIGGFFHIPHGVVCGALLGPCIRVTIEKLREDRAVNEAALHKFASVGAMFNHTSLDDVDGCCDVLVKRIYYLTEKLEIPTLNQYGVTISDCDKIVQYSGNKNHPIALNKEEVNAVLKECIRSTL